MTASERGQQAPRLKSEGVRLSYGPVEILHGVDIAVQPGEIVGLVGPNGSGKSTWLNCMAGVLKPTHGRLSMDGVDVTRWAPHRLFHHGLGRTFQLLENFPEMSVRENLLCASQESFGTLRSRLVRFDESDEYKRAESVAEFMGLHGHLDSRLGSLSYGQQKLADIAMALMGRPSTLLLDEPLAGVNPTLGNEIVKRLETLNSEGMTIVVVEHNMRVMTRLCHRFVVLDSGSVLADGKPQEVQSRPDVLEAYFGRSRAKEAQS